jgi:hypothetical protein
VSIQGALSGPNIDKRGCVAVEIHECGDASTGSTVDEAGDDSSLLFQQATHGSIGHGHYDSDGVGLENMVQVSVQAVYNISQVVVVDFSTQRYQRSPHVK